MKTTYSYERIRCFSVILFSFIVSICVLATGCSDEDQPIPVPVESGDSTLVSFEFGGIGEQQTRTTWDDQTFPNGAVIGIFVVDEDGSVVKSNARYVYDSSTGKFNAYSSTEAVYTWSTKKYSYYAYSPYKSSCRIDSIYTSISLQTLATTMKTYDFLRAANTGIGRGVSNVSLTFNHMMAILDIDMSYYINTLGYNEEAYTGLKLKNRSGGYKVNLLAGTLTSRNTSTTTLSQRGVTTNAVRHVIVAPDISYSKGEQLGIIRFTEASGEPHDIAVKLDENLTIAPGKKSTIILKDHTTKVTQDWYYVSCVLNQHGDIDACASNKAYYSPVFTEKRTKQDYINGIATGSPYTETRTITASAIEIVKAPTATTWSVETSGGTFAVGATAENKTTSSKSLTMNIIYTDPESRQKSGGNFTAKQAANTITGGETTWNTSSAAASCSKVSFPYTLSTGTLTYTAPTYNRSAKVTGCGTITQAAGAGAATVSWSVSSWSTSSTATKASISGTTLTVPANTGAQRTATITATFSNGTTKSFTITQAAMGHVVDVE